MEKKIIDIFKTRLGVEVLEIEDYSKGTMQIVSLVRTDVANYVIKFPREGRTSSTHREAFFLEKFKGKIPIPEMVLSTDDYIIQTFVEGDDLSDMDLDEELLQKTYTELGQIFKIIHGFKMEGFGFVNKDGRGEFESLREVLYQYRDEDLAYIKDNNIITDDEYLRLLDYLDRNDSFADLKESVLLHFDFEDWNIKVKDGKVSGIIDFGNLSAGPVAFEFARPFISGHADKRLEYLLETYGEVDKDELEYFVIVSLIWMIHRHHKSEKKHKFERNLNVLRSIIN